jgi:hypothetical protein
MRPAQIRLSSPEDESVGALVDHDEQPVAGERPTVRQRDNRHIGWSAMSHATPN